MGVAKTMGGIHMSPSFEMIGGGVVAVEGFTKELLDSVLGS